MSGAAKKRIGTVLDGRYLLEDLIGSGNTGAVYRATHQYTGREVAVKVMHVQLMNDDEAVARFLREAQAVTKIGHSAVVKVVDAGESENWPYLVLEFLKGRSLGQVVRDDGPLSGPRVIELAKDLLAGMAAAHACGIVHRDIKPDNVFILDEPQETRVKILDFGLAKNMAGSRSGRVLTKPGSTLGTPSYMSPEQARGGEIDQRTDLWSVGGVFFFALAGRPHFPEKAIPMLLIRLISGTPEKLADVVPDAPPKLQMLVDRALKPVDERWPSAEEMLAALNS